MDYKKLLRLLPFAILFILSALAWIEMLSVTHVAKIRHVICGVLVLINVILYFSSFRMGVLLTGITLFLATINLAAFTTRITTRQYWIGPMKFPVFQPLALLLLIFFLIVNLKYLIDAFRTKKA